MLGRLKIWAKGVKNDVVALYFASRDPRTPLAAKCVAIFIVAYALSPIDLIPDFIPLLGYLDDLLIVPLGIMLAVKLIPAELMAEFRANVEERNNLPRNQKAKLAIILIWCCSAAFIVWFLVGYFNPWPGQ